MTQSTDERVAEIWKRLNRAMAAGNDRPPLVRFNDYAPGDGDILQPFHDLRFLLEYLEVMPDRRL